MENEKQITKKLSSLSETESKELLKSLIHNALSGEREKDNLSIKDKLQRLKECKEAINNKHNFN